MRKTHLCLLPVLAAALWLAGAALRPAGRQAPTPAPDTMQFRIVVGLTDQEPKDWSGKIVVSGGSLAALEGYRFSGGDGAEPGGSFRFQTRIGNLENQLRTTYPYGETDWNSPEMRRLIPAGLLVRLRGPRSQRVRFECASAIFEFAAGEVGLRSPLSVLDGNGRVEELPVETNMSEAGRADDFPAIALGPKEERWLSWLSYQDEGDEVVVSGGGQTTRVTGKGDHHAPAIAVDGGGRVHVVWSQNDGGVFHVYESVLEGNRWGKAEKLSSDGGSNIWPYLASDGARRLALVWQAFRNEQSVILARVWDGRAWGAETKLNSGPGNCWAPSAGFGGGRLWFTWDSYQTGNYQVYARQWGENKVWRVTRGENFCVRPSVAVSPKGVPVIGWEESDPRWGKDFAFLTDGRGTTLYLNRRIRVAYLEGGDWKETEPVAGAIRPEIRRFLQQPRLAFDGQGRLHMAFRSRTSAANARIDHFAGGGRWEVFLTQLTGSRWAPATLLASSEGRNSMRAALAAAKDQVHIAWATDHRAWPGNRYGDLDIHVAAVPAEASPAELSGGRPLAEETAKAANPHPSESVDTARIRAYHISINGKTYRILRGDLHRHTELSGDGAGDGSLDDLYRYALDAAQMDYAHVGDHQMGNSEEYNWWITQKSNDLYHMPRRFVPLYGYERSVPYPNGHRNVVWARRGKPVLRIDEAERKGEANSGPILYPYLRKTEGIATSHTSATQQGTDWRDNDPDLEPIVELYQGFESSYEHAGAPRAWTEGAKPVHQGMRPQGFIWEAWKQDYKLGVQASSDHVSTHTSYACILVEDFTREGLLDAMRKRRTYAATDQIVMDYRIQTSAGWSLMGDITTSAAPPKLLVKIIGTAPIKVVDVIKNNQYVHKLNPARQEVGFEYVDNAFAGGESYYYVRAEQTDGQLVWSSPIWVSRRP